MSNILEQIKSGGPSRLIPVVSDMSKEERAISPLLAIFSAVPALANSMLEEVGAPTNQRAKLKCYSQVVFKEAPNEKKLRPDGLIMVDSGRKVWSALIEAKIGKAELGSEQIEAYLELARSLGIDAVITISNQFATFPTHHPVQINKQKTRTVELFHFSWLSVLARASLLANSKEVDDPEQAFLLRELIRYLQHETSGVCEFTSMGPEWKDICAKVQTGAPLSKADPLTLSTVADWHQLIRFLALKLSMEINKQVNVWMPRVFEKDASLWVTEDSSQLAKSNSISAELEIPHAVSRILVEADFLRRSIRFAVSLNAPEDRSRPSAAVNWVLRQLPKTEEVTDTLIRARWPGRASDTVATLAEANSDPKRVAPDDRKELPIGFDVFRIVDLAGRFKGSSTFVDDIRIELTRFYGDIVQKLTNWVAKPPKLQEVPAASADSEISFSTEPSAETAQEITTDINSTSIASTQSEKDPSAPE